MPDLKGRFVSVPLSDRFWPKVVKTDSCWIWQANKTEDNYGRIRVEGKMPPAHHVSYYLKHGEWLPFNLELDHTCKNPSCVRWAYGHLEAVSHEEHAARTSLTHPNRVKTHCIRNHNRWAFRPNGKRYCMDCNLLRVKGML